MARKYEVMMENNVSPVKSQALWKTNKKPSNINIIGFTTKQSLGQNLCSNITASMYSQCNVSDGKGE